ncbi:MAG: hypothetical protein D6824_01260, partial [Planctomycetota bacterium]
MRSLTATAGLLAGAALTAGCAAGSANSAARRETASGQVAAAAQRRIDPALRQRALAIMATTPLIDGHNDVPWGYRARVHNHIDQLDLAGDTSALDRPMHTDLRRLRQGRVGGQFWSVYVPIEKPGGDAQDVVDVLEQIDLVHRLVDRYSD